MKTICCIGAGYVGGPTIAVMARHCPEYRFVVTDVDAAKIQAWQSDRLPVYEPGLDELVAQTLNRNLFFSTDISRAIREADIVFVSVNTPTKTFGRGAGRAADLQYWEKTARHILEAATTDKVVVEKSTLPVRTAAAMGRILHAGGRRGSLRGGLEPGVHGGRHGGGRPGETGSRVDRGEKHTRRPGRRRERRGHLPALGSAGEDHHHGGLVQRTVETGGQCVPGPAGQFDQCRLGDLRGHRRGRAGGVPRRRHGPPHRKPLPGSRRRVRGLLLSEGYSQHSPAIRVCGQLAEERADVVVCYPEALANARHDLAPLGDAVSFEEDPYRAAEGAHAIALLTGWQQYRELDYQRVFDAMIKPAFVFDGRNALDHRQLFEIGFNVYPVGKQPLSRL